MGWSQTDADEKQPELEVASKTPAAKRTPEYKNPDFKEKGKFKAAKTKTGGRKP